MFGTPTTTTQGFGQGTPAGGMNTTAGGGGGAFSGGGNMFSFSAGTGAAGGGGTAGFGGFNLTGAGTGGTTAPSTGFSFTTATTKPFTGATAGFGGFSFGPSSQAQPLSTTTSNSMAFGNPASGSGGLTLGQASLGTSIFGSVKPSTAVVTPATSVPAVAGFTGFGTTTSSLGGAGGSLLSGLLTSTSSASVPPAAAVTTAAASTTSSGFTLGPCATTGAATAFNFGTPAAAPSATTTAAAAAPAPQQGFSFMSTASQPATSAASLASSLGVSSATTSAVTSAFTTTTAVPALSGPATSFQKQMTFRQLEETINKWTTELEEQEKYFLDQATQVNAWDRIVMENGDRIVQLNKDVEKVKLDQQKLDHELDFVHSQQKELEDIVTNLEKALDSLPPISYQQHADVEREHTYILAESLDSQLKRMGQDLKEIIDRLNSTNTAADPNDPVQQITKILNAHVVSLMWVDRHSANLQRRVEEISKQMDSEKREQERNFRLAYN